VRSQVSTQPCLVYGDEEGCEVYGSEYSLGAVGLGAILPVKSLKLMKEVWFPGR